MCCVDRCRCCQSQLTPENTFLSRCTLPLPAAVTANLFCNTYSNGQGSLGRNKHNFSTFGAGHRVEQHFRRKYLAGAVCTLFNIALQPMNQVECKDSKSYSMLPQPCYQNSISSIDPGKKRGTEEIREVELGYAGPRSHLLPGSGLALGQVFWLVTMPALLGV